MVRIWSVWVLLVILIQLLFCQNFLRFHLQGKQIILKGSTILFVVMLFAETQQNFFECIKLLLHFLMMATALAWLSRFYELSHMCKNTIQSSKLRPQKVKVVFLKKQVIFFVLKLWPATCINVWIQLIRADSLSWIFVLDYFFFSGNWVSKA